MVDCIIPTKVRIGDSIDEDDEISDLITKTHIYGDKSWLENEHKDRLYAKRGYYQFDSDEPFTARHGPEWLPLFFRIMLLTFSLSVFFYRFVTGDYPNYIYLSNLTNLLTILTCSVGIIHFFIDDKKNSIWTDIYGNLYANNFTWVFLVITVVTGWNSLTWLSDSWPLLHNALNLMPGEETGVANGHLNNWTYANIVDHIVVGMLIYVPFLYEKVDIKDSYVGSVFVLFGSYLYANLFYGYFTGKHAYSKLTFTHLSDCLIVYGALMIIIGGFLIGYNFSYHQKKNN